MRGKKISKEQAEKIIITETESRVFAFNNEIPDYDEFDHDSIKKPQSIREAMDEEEKEKSIDENSYIKSYDKLYKEYNTIIDNCFMY